MPGDDLNEALRAFLRVGVFIGLGGVILALAITPNTCLLYTSPSEVHNTL